jgi:ubiquitin-protein ligase
MSVSKRVTRDIKELIKNQDELRKLNIFIDIDDKDIRHFYFMFIGPENTPYHNGYYIFEVRIPDNFPVYPPKLKFLIRNDSRLDSRYFVHPHLYNDGNVCVDILNTGGGSNNWSPILTLYKIILSVHNLFSENYLSVKWRDEIGRRTMTDNCLMYSQNVATGEYVQKNSPVESFKKV